MPAPKHQKQSLLPTPYEVQPYTGWDAFIWPQDVRAQFQKMLRHYREMIDSELFKEDNYPVLWACWAPWRLLSREQCIWMLGRLSSVWVHKQTPLDNPTAWDEGGARVIWEHVAAMWADEDSDFFEEEDHFMTSTGLVKLLRRHNRVAHEDHKPAKIIYVAKGEPNVIERYERQEFTAELDDFLDRLFLDTDYLFLKVGPNNILTSGMAPGMGEFLDIRTDYFRCPIPEVVSESDLLWAEQRLRARVTS